MQRETAREPPEARGRAGGRAPRRGEAAPTRPSAGRTPTPSPTTARRRPRRRAAVQPTDPGELRARREAVREPPEARDGSARWAGGEAGEGRRRSTAAAETPAHASAASPASAAARPRLRVQYSQQHLQAATAGEPGLQREPPSLPARPPTRAGVIGATQYVRGTTDGVDISRFYRILRAAPVRDALHLIRAGRRPLAPSLVNSCLLNYSGHRERSRVVMTSPAGVE